MPDIVHTNPFRQFLHDSFVWDIRQSGRDRRQAATDHDAVAAWEEQGRPVPPPELVKRTTLADFGAAFNIDTLVETGTFLGGTMHALKNQFRTLYTIELSPAFAMGARRRFRHDPNIHIIEGDSAELLPSLLSTIHSPVLFWLDGHYSGNVTAKATLETPIVKELETIFQHEVKDHVILIDDARHFDGTHDYPTLNRMRDLFAQHRPDFQFTVHNDSIRAHPPKEVKLTF